METFWYQISQWEADMLFGHLLLRLWLYLGESEWILRSLSVVFGVATVPAVYILGMRLFGPKAGLISATLLSLHTFHVQNSQEGRSYALVILLVLSTYFFFRALEAPHNKKYWLTYRLVSVVAVYAHGFALLVRASQWLSLGVLRLRNVKLWFNIAPLILLCLPIVVFLLLWDVGQLSWVPEPTLQRLLSAFLELTGGGSYAIPTLYIAVCAPTVSSAVNSSSDESSDKNWFIRLLSLWLIFPAATILVISFLADYCIVRLSHRRSPSSVLVSVSCLGLMLTLSSWDLVRYFHNRSEMQNE
jgi:uncharacterized membrane protein